MLTPRQIIEDIRRSQYGIGLSSDSSSQPVIANMRAMLDRTLKLLSQDLYAKDIHFVLELLQNAEDNNYAPDVVPEVRFILTEDAILVQNNELGFAEENVRSLCDVAKSSKAKRPGYIGEKGIGFKSVFRVTDEPYISSNGFSFCLPLHDAQMNLGYVIPVWREKRPTGIDLRLTNILLPLTPRGRLELPKVADIEPSLLLFLKKLRRIEICDAAGACTKWIEREDEGNRVHIRSSTGTDRWRVMRRLLPVPSEVVEEKRQGVPASEIVLAFPLTANDTADASIERPVYSFLPVRPCGFRFAIQADFILASSREDILADRPWNQWLRNSIAPLFLEAVELFKADDSLRTTYLAFVPTATQVTDAFFEDIPGTIVESLKQAECILTASGRWAKPSEVLLVGEQLRQLLTNDDVKDHLQKEFIDKTFQVDAKVLQLLGVGHFGFGDLVTCLKDTKWLAAKGEGWLVRMLAYLNRTWSKDSLDVLCKLTLVPLEGGTLDSPTTRQIFFPLDRRTSYGFEQGLRIVRRSLFKAGDATTVDAARKFLRGSLGVRPAEPIEVINEHILPVFEGTDSETNWQSKDTGFLIGAVEYVKDHLDQFLKGGGLLERLAKGLWIKYVHADGNMYTKATVLYLSSGYGNQNDLESLFSVIDDIRFVDPAYLDHSLSRQKKTAKHGETLTKQRREQAESWQTFFMRLGVETVLRISLPSSANGPDQVASEDLAKLIKTKDVKRITKALELLNAHWSRYRQYLRVEQFTVQRNRRHSLGKVPTSFYKLICGSDWIPTYNHGLCKPYQVCVDCPENKDLLGNHVPYLAIDLEDENLVSDLGIQTRPSIPMVLSCLRTLVENRVEDVKKVGQLYEYLDNHFEESSASITTAFQQESMIFLPGKPGRFVKQTEVFWKDVSGLFGNTRGYLCRHWKELKSFFLERLKVDLVPAPEDYVALLKELSSAGSLASDDVRKVWEVYRELDRQLSIKDAEDAPTRTSWWRAFVDSGLYWTDRAEFWQNEGDVYINDHEDYYELFKGKGDFAFLMLPENQYPSFMNLIEAGKLPMLSQAVQECEITPRQPRQDSWMTGLLREAAPFIVRYLYFKENEVYRLLQKADVLRQISQTMVCLCAGVTVVFEFHGIRIEVDRDVAGTLPRLYVRADVDDPVDRIGGMLAKLLHSPRGLDSFICLVLTKKNNEGMERLMEAQRIPPMPADLSAPLLPANEPDHESSPEEMPVEEEPTDQSLQASENEAGESSRVAESVARDSRSKPELTIQPPVESAAGASETPHATETKPQEKEVDRDPAEIEFSGKDRSHVSPSHSKHPLPNSGRERQGHERREDTHEEIDRETDRPGSRQRKDESDRTPRERPARNWFRVLARPDEPSESIGHGDPPPKDDLARQKVIEYEQRRDRAAEAAPSNQEGYDVTSDDRLRGVTRLIEIKGLLQRWTGDATVTLTGAQFDAARGEPPPGCEYWLYVVDGLGTDSPRIHPIVRLAAKVDRVYLQAQDWLCEVDQADRDRLTDKAVAELGIPILDFGEIVSLSPATVFLTRYPKSDLADIVPVGGFLKCLPLDSTKALPLKGQLVMLLPGQMPQTDDDLGIAVGEFRWSVRQSLEGEPQYVEVLLRPKTAKPGFKPISIKITIADWPHFRPYALCEPLLET